MAIRLARSVALATVVLFFFTLVRLRDSPFGRPLCHTPNTTLGDLSTSTFHSHEDATHPENAPSSPKVSLEPHSAGNAYVFYASQTEYACSVLINIHRLQNLFHTKYPIYVLVTPDLPQEYIDAFKAVGATVSVHTPPELHPASPAVEYYKDCLLKLLSFKMHQLFPSLKRVLALDSDQLILQNLDHIFDLPKVDLASPRAYWLKRDFVSSTFMVIQLSDSLWDIIDHAIKHIKVDQYDMDIVNALLGDTVLVLPGSYIMMNGHWETWQLPNWFRVEGGKSSKNEVKAKPSQSNPPEPKAAPPKVEKRQLGESADTTDSHDNTPEQQIPLDTPPESSGHHSKPSSSVPASPAKSAAVHPPPVPQIHPNHTALYDLYPAGHVLHFFALGKPWTYDLNAVHVRRPNVHPVFVEQFKTWRETAMEVCPVIKQEDENGEVWESRVVYAL